MSAERLLRDYRISMVTEGHKHSTAEWVNVHCPFCEGSRDFHMGIHEELTACHCWRCGSHSIVTVVSELLEVPRNQAWSIINKYQGRSGRRVTKEPKVSMRAFKYPQPNFPLNRMGKDYLHSRGYNAAYIAKEWGVVQTGPVAELDGMSYPHRLIIPIEWDEQIISFQTRDITGRSPRKYLVCPMARERISHKTVLYGKQQAWKDLSGLFVVEGVMDVWRFGEYAAGTFGTSFTMDQVLQLSKMNDRFIIMFDNEIPAQKKARELAIKLRTLGKEVLIKTVKDDPGSLKQEEANKLIEELI